MSTAATLLEDLQGRGFTLARVGDRIRITPAGRLTAELRDLIRRHKVAILAALEATDVLPSETLPAVAELPDRLPFGFPADAVIVIADKDAYTDREMKSEPYMWCWIDGPMWFYVKDYPVPVFPKRLA